MEKVTESNSELRFRDGFWIPICGPVYSFEMSNIGLELFLVTFRNYFRNLPKTNKPSKD